MNGTTPLTGAQKSAVLCMVLGPDGAAKILQQLAPDEVERVAREIRDMKTVEPEVVQRVLDELQSVTRSKRPPVQGGEAYARRVLEAAVGASRAQQVFERIESAAGTLGRLRHAPPRVLAGIVRDEHPQTIAMILSHLDAEQAAAVIQALPRETAGDVLHRIARMESIAPEVVQLVEQGLSRKVAMGAAPAQTAGGPGIVARLLNQTSDGLDEDLLGRIEGLDPDTAKAIRKQMFVLEDLLRIDGKGVQRLLREIETRDLAMSLKAASDELKAHIRTNMSSRAADALDEEVEMLGAVRVSEVEAAHSRLIDAVKELESQGEIVVPGHGGGGDELIS